MDLGAEPRHRKQCKIPPFPEILLFPCINKDYLPTYLESAIGTTIGSDLFSQIDPLETVRKFYALKSKLTHDKACKACKVILPSNRYAIKLIKTVNCDFRTFTKPLRVAKSVWQPFTTIDEERNIFLFLWLPFKN